MANFGSENEKLKRKCSVLQEIEQQAKQDRDSLQENITSLQFSTSQKIQELERTRVNTCKDYKATKLVLLLNHNYLLYTSLYIECVLVLWHRGAY